mgnify:CR=1 FL=1
MNKVCAQASAIARKILDLSLGMVCIMISSYSTLPKKVKQNKNGMLVFSAQGNFIDSAFRVGVHRLGCHCCPCVTVRTPTGELGSLVGIAVVADSGALEPHQDWLCLCLLLILIVYYCQNSNVHEKLYSPGLCLAGITLFCLLNNKWL